MKDPFEEVRDEVTRALTAADGQFAKWQRTRSDYVRSQLCARLSGIEMDLKDMEDALAKVEADRGRFPIDDTELQARHAFIKTSRAVVSVHLAELAVCESSTSGNKPGGSPCSKPGAGDEERDSLLASAPARKAGGKSKGKASARGAADGAQHIELIDTQQQVQQQLQAEQEEVLDGLHSAVGNLKSMSGAMNEELAQQAAIVGDLEGQVDSTATALSTLKKKMQALMPKKEGKERLILVVVSIVLIILVLLVLET
mmetsp:Transcript_51820/g.119129  ORF Transcript_51820/g.119129 Transcript_51820/m.119129 type:complete len:256 (-) Transcript_51820:163-930(-)